MRKARGSTAADPDFLEESIHRAAVYEVIGLGWTRALGALKSQPEH